MKEVLFKANGVPVQIDISALSAGIYLYHVAGYTRPMVAEFSKINIHTSLTQLGLSSRLSAGCYGQPSDGEISEKVLLSLKLVEISPHFFFPNKKSSK